jgi:hypothetical protein
MVPWLPSVSQALKSRRSGSLVAAPRVCGPRRRDVGLERSLCLPFAPPSHVAAKPTWLTRRSVNDEPNHWQQYIAKRSREGWGPAKPPTAKDYPGHPVIAEADRLRKEALRLKFAAVSAGNQTPLSPDGTSPIVAPEPQVSGTIVCGHGREFGRRGGRLRLTDEQRRESAKRRRAKDRERKRRARVNGDGRVVAA